MKFPYFSSTNKTRDYQTSFYGYNHTENCRDGEFYDMKNMSSDLYPVLSPRGKRGIYPYPDGTGKYKAVSLISKDALCYISGNDFYVNNEKVDGFFVPDVDEGKKQQLISMGAYVIFYPQGKWYNTANGEDGDVNSLFPAEDMEPAFRFSLAKTDGTDYGNLPTTKPEEGTEGENSFYIDTTVVPNVVKQYSGTKKAWVSVPTTFVKISAEGIDERFEVGDGIIISGIPENPSDSEEADKGFEKLNGANVIVSKGEGHIVITGLIITEHSLTGVKVERKMPDMDFIVESQNRLWGCKYGETEDGKVVNEIYASKLGDFKNWNCFEGIASDSYAVSVGSDGRFTGAITYQGNPIFFKENFVHKIFGSVPANYQVQTTACNGVQRGSERSLAIVNNALFYKGVGGIYAYDGSLPVLASSEFGNVEYDSAVGGASANKYYVSMRDKKTGKYVLFVYDTEKSMWHKEDDLHAEQFCKEGTNLYYISADDDLIHTVYGDGNSEEKDIKWHVETGVLGKDSPQRKYYTKLNVRMKLEPMARVSFYAEYDSTGGWQHICTVEGRTMQSFNIPIRLQRCDHLRFKIVGKGVVHIHSLSKTVKEGSDIG